MPASAPSPAEWLPYMDGSAAMLAVFLVALAGTCAYIGMKIRNPISVSRPGRVVSGFLIAIWALAIYTFFVALYVYALQLRQVYPHFARPPKVRVGTLVDAAATFLVILYLTRRYGWKIAVGSAFAGTAAAPMLFELPFDLIVMPMTYPAIPPAPTLYRELFFLPLFIVELSTISLLALLPSMRITGKVPVRTCGHACGVCGLGSLRFQLSRGTAALDAQRHLEAAMLRHSDPTVRLARSAVRPEPP